MQYEVIEEFFKNVFSSSELLLAAICIGLFVWGMYNKIKYLCLEKASKFVAEVEQDEEKSGTEKFITVLEWINEELPKIFKNSMFRTVVEKIINIAYNSSFEYMKNYIKRKTGTDVANVIEAMKDDVKKELATEDIEVKNEE